MKRILKWIFRIVLVLLVLAFLFVFVAYWRSTNDCGKTAGATNPMMMFMTGKIKAKGDLGLAANIANYFNLPKA